MRRLFTVGVVVLAAGAIAVAPAGAATDEERIPAIGASTNPVDACTASFPADSFQKVASEGTVAPGQKVAIDVTWRPAWHTGDKVDVLGCVAANGHFVDGAVERGVDNNGLWVHKFTVPSSAAKDAVVCQAALVIGPGADGKPQAERSDPDCFTVAGAATSAEQAPAPSAGTNAAAPTAPVAAAPAPPKAAPAESAAPAKVTATTTAPRAAAAATAPPKVTAAAQAPKTQLPHTGARERALVLLAGVLLIVGGWALGAGRRSASALQ